jgi:hypothetical protein
MQRWSATKCISVVGLTALVGVTCWVCCDGSGAPATTASRANGAAIAESTPSFAAVVQRESEPPSMSKTLRFLESGNDRPLAGVRVIEQVWSPTLAESLPALVTAGGDGTAVIPKRAHEAVVIAMLAGWMPAAVDMATVTATADVHLQHAAPLSIRCVDADSRAPLQGCVVVAANERFRLEARAYASGALNPAVMGGVACGVSDVDGRMAIGLPACEQIWVAAYGRGVLATDDFVAQRQPIPMPAGGLVLQFRPAYGVCAALPDGRRAHGWRFTGVLQRGQDRSFDCKRLERDLQGAHPDCGVSVVGTRESEHEGEIFACAEDGSLWSARTRLLRVNDIVEPVVLTRHSGASGWIRVDVSTLAGPLLDQPLALVPEEDHSHGYWPFVSGRVTQVPCGVYEIGTDGEYSPDMEAWINRSGVEIKQGTAAEPLVVTFQARSEVGVLRCTYHTHAGDHCDAWGVSVSVPHGQFSDGFTNMLEREHCSIYVPAGRVRLTFTAYEHDAVTQEFVIRGNETRDVDVLFERSRVR